MSSSLICEQSHDSVITMISKEFAETIAKSSPNLLTIDLRLLKKIFGKFGKSFDPSDFLHEEALFRDF